MGDNVNIDTEYIFIVGVSGGAYTAFGYALNTKYSLKELLHGSYLRFAIMV